jgi:hypothetical protein
MPTQTPPGEFRHKEWFEDSGLGAFVHSGVCRQPQADVRLSTVSVTRVITRQHFAPNVWVASLVGYLIGNYVAYKQQTVGPIRPVSLDCVCGAVLET